MSIIESPTPSSLDTLISFLNLQRSRTPYGKMDPAALLFGKDHRAIIQSISGGEVHELFELHPEQFSQADPTKQKRILDEFADVLLGVINLGLAYGIDIQTALQHVYEKIYARFNRALELAKQRREDITSETQASIWLQFWNQAKEQFKVSGRQLEFGF